VQLTANDINSAVDLNHEVSTTQSKDLEEPRSSCVTYTVLATERYNEKQINFYYKATITENGLSRSEARFHVLPGLLTESVLLGTGLVPCPQLPNCTACSPPTNQFALPLAVVKDGWQISRKISEQFQYFAGLACILWSPSITSDIERCLVVCLARKHDAYLLLKGRSCIYCCSKEAAKTKLMAGVRKKLIFIL